MSAIRWKRLALNSSTFKQFLILVEIDPDYWTRNTLRPLYLIRALTSSKKERKNPRAHQGGIASQQYLQAASNFPILEIFIFPGLPFFLSNNFYV